MIRLNLLFSLLFILSPISFAFAQQEAAKVTNASSAPLITAAASAERVRFAAPGTVVQLRLQVYSDAAQSIFDATSKGNVLDWSVQDGTGARLVEGKYLCVVTVKSLSGRLSQRIVEISVGNHTAELRGIEKPQLTMAQQQEIGPMEDDAAIAILNGTESEMATVVAHNGEEGQITRSRGALSFRMGDFFRGNDIEQMRLTADGNLGIGMTHPQVRLDVDGMIRSSQGIVFPDGSVQFSAARKTFGAASLTPGQSKHVLAQGQEHLSPDTTGTGTTGKIPKWLDGPAGVLTDSNITEASNSIGINGSPDSRFKLDVNGTTRIRGSNPAFNLEGLRSAGNQWVFQTVDDDGRFRLFGQDNVNPGVERLTIKLDTGNVGIGTTSPGAKLHVAGSMHVGSMHWGLTGAGPGVAPPYVYTDEDVGGLYLEQVGTTTANSKIRLQSSITGDQTSYSQFFINPENGFSFVSNGAANGKVGIGTTSPQTKLDVVGSLQTRGGPGLKGIYAFGGDGNSGLGGDGVQAVGGSGFGGGGLGVYAFGGAAVSSSGVGGDGVVGVFGAGNTDGRAGFFFGNVSVQGTLSKGSGSFKIDHPLDPANKYLYHSFVESPDMMNIYNGNITTDEKGEATIALPEYFEALNRDFRYQLTVLGTFAQAIVADKIKGNRFVIKTTEPKVEVSWQVTGIRKDAFADKHRIQAEADKPDNERGFYLYPELFNQSEERSVEWVRNPELMKRIKEQREKAKTISTAAQSK